MKTITCARCKSVLRLLQYTQNQRAVYYLDPAFDQQHQVDNLYIHGTIEPSVLITECRRVAEV